MYAGTKRLVIALTVMTLGATVAGAQTAAGKAAAPEQAASGATMRLTLDDAVRLALQNNLDIAVDRLDPQVAGQRVSQASAAFLPSAGALFGRSHQVQPPANLLVNPGGTTTDIFNSVLGVAQRVMWTGATYGVSWNASRQTTNSFFNSFSPSLGSTMQLSFSQPLMRDLAIDAPRQQLIVTKRNREISDTRFRETVVRTIADVKRAYWTLVAARASVEVQQKALELANELVRTNTRRVDVGQSPPLDLMSAKAEQAQREENVVVAQVLARQSEDALRLLILDQDSASFWDERMELADATPIGAPLPDLDTVVRQALKGRQDLIRARDEVANAETSVKFYQSQRLPDLRFSAGYGASGIGGTRLIRTGGFPGTITGSEATDFGSVMNQMLGRDFPTWTVGFTLTYPIGYSYEKAGLTSARIQESQARLRLQNAEAKAVRQLRAAAWQLEANQKRIETSRAAREFAEERLTAEQKRFDVGMSTSFLVVQAQRDLAQARNNELAAALDYARALVDFEALQEAGPAGSSIAATTGTVVSMAVSASLTSSSTSTSTVVR